MRFMKKVKLTGPILPVKMRRLCVTPTPLGSCCCQTGSRRVGEPTIGRCAFLTGCRHASPPGIRHPVHTDGVSDLGDGLHVVERAVEEPTGLAEINAVVVGDTD